MSDLVLRAMLSFSLLGSVTCFKTVFVRTEQSVNDRKGSMRWEKNREPELFFAPVSSQHSSVSIWAICCMCMPVPAPTPHLVVPEWAMLYENTKGQLNTTQEVGLVLYFLVSHTWNSPMVQFCQKLCENGLKCLQVSTCGCLVFLNTTSRSSLSSDTRHIPKLIFLIKNRPFLQKFLNIPQVAPLAEMRF